MSVRFRATPAATLTRASRRSTAISSASCRGPVGNNTIDNLAFLDSRDIPLGAKWESTLERELLACRTFIALLSPTLPGGSHDGRVLPRPVSPAGYGAARLPAGRWARLAYQS